MPLLVGGTLTNMPLLGLILDPDPGPDPWSEATSKLYLRPMTEFIEQTSLLLFWAFLNQSWSMLRKFIIPGSQ